MFLSEPLGVTRRALLGARGRRVSRLKGVLREALRELLHLQRGSCASSFSSVGLLPPLRRLR